MVNHNVFYSHTQLGDLKSEPITKTLAIIIGSEQAYFLALREFRLREQQFTLCDVGLGKVPHITRSGKAALKLGGSGDRKNQCFFLFLA